ncbi:MAG: elongation factor P [Candidatus Shikimatogenerans bostrichidophilus]|nr:MAG: elongation factor P [Candidatus Shikimatogenerans bostrichidophilus]
MLINISKIKKGIYIEKNNNCYKIIDFLHVKPGKGNAYVRTKIKNIKNGNIIKYIIPCGIKINKINIISKFYTFLYKDSNKYILIDKKSYNLISLSKVFFYNYSKLIKKNDIIEIIFNKDNNEPLFIKYKNYVTLKVIKSEFIIKGNTKKNKYKKSILETGLSIYTPLFIKEGDYIKINTKTLKYIERVK